MIMTWKQLAEFAAQQCLQFADEPVTAYASIQLRGLGSPLYLEVTDSGFDDRGPSITIALKSEL